MMFEAFALHAISFRAFLKTETQRRIGILHLIAHLLSFKTGKRRLAQILPSPVNPCLQNEHTFIQGVDHRSRRAIYFDSPGGFAAMPLKSGYWTIKPRNNMR
ncbi:hypothetical protein ABIB73_007502 [Bradyrhizobium sp. F1.4.3]